MQGLQPLAHWLAAVAKRCPTEERFQTPENTQSLISTFPSISRSDAATEMPLVECSIAMPWIVIQGRPLARMAHCDCKRKQSSSQRLEIPGERL